MTSANPQILIVEDDPDLSDMVSSYFRAQSYDVRAAEYGEEALAIAAEHPLDLIILDVRLPDIDGFELCRRLREKRRTENIPIIFLTEKQARRDKLTGLELGVVDYITKPFDIQELRLRVRNCILRSQRAAAIDPVTELPEGDLVLEKIHEVATGGKPAGALAFALAGMHDFRERFGFVAADDVLRAVTLMIKNAVRDFGGEVDFIGHLEPEAFVILTVPERLNQIKERIERRISQSADYFFPQSRPGADNQLLVKSTQISITPGAYADGTALRKAMMDALQK